ncbi:uncharacterized protein LOC107036975 [Diachasma alloeum]|uniref:uncharacterized protein LOC107036975 n=1 Tax=Diachasma alloeum TaxID=454923 RepID=UPI0007384AE8|nr:uncharacterized protein LOC107036975 [Diachasma alloeum]
MKAFRIIVIWVCITAIKEKNLLAKATWSLPAAPKLPTKKAEEQTKPVVLVPVDQNTTADRSNEVDWKSIPHPEHKTKRCKSLTPLRKVRLSAPLKKVNNDETESQSGSAMNKIEVAFPSSKMKNTTPKPEYLPTSTFDDPSDSTSLPRFVKHIDENDENALDYSYHTRDLEEAWARGRGREPFTGQEKKKKYLCYCLDEECARRDPLKSLYSGRNRPAPKLLQNTDLYSQIEALAAANSEEDRGEEYRGLPLIYRKQGSRRPADKRLKSKKCTPVLVACEPTDKPTKISLPLRMQTNRGSPRPPARPFRPVESNYQRFSAEGAPNVPYGPPYDVYQLPSPRLSSLQGIPELPHLGSAYAGVEVSCSNPAFSSLEECVKFCGRDVCYAAMNYGYSGYYPQHDNYQPPMIGSPHAEYGYDNYPGNYAPTGVLDSSTDYIVRLPDDEGNSGGEEAQAGRGNQQYPDLAEGETFVGSSSDCSAPPQIESEIESYDVAEGDLPGLGRPHNVVQPGFTHESQVKLVNIPREDHNVIVQPGFTHESQVTPLEIPREDHNVIVQPGFTHESQVKLVGIPREDHNVIVQPGFTHESQVKPLEIPREDHNVIVQPGFTHESQVKLVGIPREDHNVIVQPGFTHESQVKLVGIPREDHNVIVQPGFTHESQVKLVGIPREDHNVIVQPGFTHESQVKLVGIPREDHNVIVQPGFTHESQVKLVGIPREDHNVIVQPGFTHESQVKLVGIPREDHNVIVQPGFTHESQVKLVGIPREDHNVIVQPGFTHESQVKLVGIPREDHNVIVQPGFTHESQVKLVGIPREDHNVIVQPGFTHESQVKPLESPRKDHNVIVQPGFTHAFNDDNSAEGEATVAHSESTEDCAESPEPETYEAIETPLHAAHQDNPEDVDEENCTYPEEPTEGYRVPGVYPDPGNYGSQFDTTLPSPTPWNFYEGDSPKASIIGKSYGPSESAVDNNNYQKAEAPVGPQQSEFPDCPQAEPVSASADQHLHDLEALTGLSIEDSKLLRGAIYESINRVASSAKQEIESNKVSSSCDIIGAPEPAKIPGLGDNSLLRNLLHTSEVRNLVLGTIKALIPQVTGTSRDSGLGKLADNIINRSLSVVLGEDDLPEDSGEPSLGLVNENVGSMPDQIMRILSSLINQPGVGLENARLPGIQNIIVRTLGEILRRGKNVVDNAVIWEALNDVLNPEEGPVVAPKTPRPTQPELPKPLLPRARVHDDKVIMKPLGYFPVTEHYIKKGQWYESSATIGYKGEFPGDFPDAVRPADSENAVAPQDYSHLGSPKDADCVTEEANTPIKYQSPQNIVLEYIKNHPAGEANLGAAISGDDDADDCASEEPIIGDQLESYDDRSPHDFTGSGGKESGGSAGSPVSNPTYFGRITSPNAGGISGIGDLEGSELLYIGDGVKLPLSIKRMEDGSLALMLSEKICRSFVQKNCPCCLPQQGGQVRYSRRAGEKGNTRGIRSSTINSDEADDSPSSGEDAGAVAVMPVEKFVEKYNLTLNLGDNGEINSWRDKSGKLERRGTESMVNYVEDGREREDSEDSGENDEDVSVILSPSDRDEYIQELLAMQNAPVNDRAAIVINALDDLLNFSAEGGAGEEGQSADGFEYQKDNPFMKRVENIKEGQSGHGGYKYQRNLEDTARVRMEVAKDVLHWLKELIVKSKTSGMG